MTEPEQRGTPAQGNTKVDELVLRREARIQDYLMVTIGTQKESELYDEIIGLTDAISMVEGEQIKCPDVNRKY